MEVREDSKKISRLLSMRGEERVMVDDDLVACIRQTVETINQSGGSCIKLAFLETIRREIENGEWFNYQLLFEFPKAEDHIKYLSHEFLEIGHLLQKLESNIPENIMKDIDSIGVDEFDTSRPNSYYLLLYVLRNGKD